MLDAWIIDKINQERRIRDEQSDDIQPSVHIPTPIEYPDLPVGSHLEDPTEEVTIPNGERRGWEDITDNGRVVVNDICTGIHNRVGFTL